MMMPVRWFFYVPCVINVALALAIGASAGRAIGDGDFARGAVLLFATGLLAASAAACGIAADKP